MSYKWQRNSRYSYTESSKWLTYNFCEGFVVMHAILASFVPGFSIIFVSLVGSSVCTLLAFYFSALIHLKAFGFKILIAGLCMQYLHHLFLDSASLFLWWGAQSVHCTLLAFYFLALIHLKAFKSSLNAPQKEIDMVVLVFEIIFGYLAHILHVLKSFINQRYLQKRQVAFWQKPKER